MVITNSLALKLAFEGILKAILRQGSPELSLQVSWVEREDGGGLLLLETNPSKDQWIERKLVEQAQTMLRPYGVKVQTDQQSVALEFPNINTILASPLASR
jgi:hypothetical protein